MAKKILIISTSLRDKSNSEMLADAFMDGANALEDDAGGVNEAGEIKEHPALKKAYEMGIKSNNKKRNGHGRKIGINRRMG